MKKAFPAALGELDNVIAFAEAELENLGCPMKAAMSIKVALEELFVNIAQYAYPGEKGVAEIEVIAETGQSAVTVRVIDSGVRFDPLEKKDPDVSLSVGERAIGGLGIFMVKKMMDDVRYEYRDGKNIVTMTKVIK